MIIKLLITFKPTYIRIEDKIFECLIDVLFKSKILKLSINICNKKLEFDEINKKGLFCYIIFNLKSTKICIEITKYEKINNFKENFTFLKKFEEEINYSDLNCIDIFYSNQYLISSFLDFFNYSKKFVKIYNDINLISDEINKKIFKRELEWFKNHNLKDIKSITNKKIEEILL